MNISEMHVWFRQYAQQMGMQKVRAILPEQIDLVINTAISDTVNEIVSSDLGVRNDRVIADAGKILQINALRSLYSVKEIPLLGATLPFKYDVANHFNGRYSLDDAYLGLPDAMYWADFSLNYCKCTSGWAGAVAPIRDTATPFTTNFYPVRFIEDAFLADTLNDFILKPRLRSPIIIAYNGDANSKIHFDMYIDKFDKTTGMLINSLAPYTFRVSYIAKPAVVSYAEDLSGTNVNCNLPDYMHVDILKHAVDLYRTSIGGGISANQEAGKQQQRENYRNEAPQN